jgi:CheY-like chemotaxis protein
LATAYSIISRHDGHIAAESELGVGTTFHVYLRAADMEMADTREQHPEPLPGEGRILVMDDEESIRKVAGEMLSQLGYRIEFAGDGDEAIAIFREAKSQGEAFAAVIMDLTIPGGIGGKEAIERLREIDPTIKGIVSSGYSNDPVMSDFADYGFAGVVAKPYNIEELSRTLHRVIREKEERP